MLGDIIFAVVWYVIAYLIFATFRFQLMDLPSFFGIALIMFGMVFPFTRQFGFLRTMIYCLAFGVLSSIFGVLVS